MCFVVDYQSFTSKDFNLHLQYVQAVLQRLEKGKQMVLIACASQIFSNLKIKYSMSELNFLAIVWALEHFRLVWANISFYYKSRSTLINLHFCLSSTGNCSTAVEANTDVIHCFQFNAEQQLQFFEIFLVSNAACITYSLQFEFSGYYSHDQPSIHNAQSTVWS